MAKPEKNQNADPFAGLKPEQIESIKAYLDSELRSMESMLNEAAQDAKVGVVSVAEAAGLSAEADAGTLMSAVESMHGSTSHFIAAIESHVREAAQSADHASHAAFSRLATVFGEFRNGLGTILSAK